VFDHEKKNEHKIAMAKWEVAHFPSSSMVLCLDMFNMLLKKDMPELLLA
jgi:hypothetical protein